MVSPDVVSIGSEYFVVYFRVYICSADHVGLPVESDDASPVHLVYFRERLLFNVIRYCRTSLIRASFSGKMMQQTVHV